MQEFLEACLSPINLALTVLLVLVVLYWLMVIIGALAFDSLDVDLDADADVDVDVDMDVDVDADVDLDADIDVDADLSAGDVSGAAAGGAGLGIAMLRLVGLGEVPLMVLVSVWVLSMWFLGIALYSFIGDWTMALQVAMLVPYAIAALIIARILTLPLAVFFRKLKAQEKAEQKLELIGRRCRVTSGRATARYGQIEVEMPGAPLLLNAKLTDKDAVLTKGQEAVIVSRAENGRYYMIRGF